jgi:hypothetical protein
MPAGELEVTDREVDRDDAAVPSEEADRPRVPDHRGLTGLEVAREVGVVLGTALGWEQHLHALAPNRFGFPAQQVGRGRVDQPDAADLVETDHAVRESAQGRLEPGDRFAGGAASLLALCT